MKLREKTVTLAEVSRSIGDIGDNIILKKIIIIVCLIISIIICNKGGIYEEPQYPEENYQVLEQAVSYFIIEDETLCIKQIPDSEIKYSVENVDGGYDISLKKGICKLDAKIVNGKKTIERQDSKASYLVLYYICMIFVAPLIALILFAVVSTLWLIVYLVFSAMEFISKFLKYVLSSLKK